MGSMIRYRCTCGLTGQLPLGGGRLNFATFCGVPALCHDCPVICTINAMGEHVCPDCNDPVELLYDEHASPPPAAAMSWRRPDNDATVVVKPGPHVCPKCEQRALVLSDAGVHFD